MGKPMKRVCTAALILAVGAAVAVSPAAEAETMLIVPGAEYALCDLVPAIPLVSRYYTRSIDIGRGFYPDSTPVVVNYPASIFAKGTIADHVAAGAAILDAAIKAESGPTIVAGHSEGSVVVDAEQARLQADPNAPAADQLTFIIFGDPTRGVMNTVFRPGTQIPIVGLTATPPVESRYDTVVVTNEYDFWGDFPDRPWNLVALANAVMGAAFVHTRVSFSPSDVPLSNISTTTNSLGATVTTYLVPTQHLPLTEALRIVGVPAKIVDTIDNVLRPIIDAGYSRNDAPGSTRPYLFHGAIRTGPTPTANTAASGAPAVVETTHSATGSLSGTVTASSRMQHGGANAGLPVKGPSRTHGSLGVQDRRT